MIMAPDPRSRVISIRLTADEYACFRELCLAQGIRTLSEMARSAMQNMLHQSLHPPPAESVEVRLGQIESRVRLLSLEVKRLSKG
jgi:hypothetical protein